MQQQETERQEYWPVQFTTAKPRITFSGKIVFARRLASSQGIPTKSEVPVLAFALNLSEEATRAESCTTTITESFRRSAVSFRRSRRSLTSLGSPYLLVWTCTNGFINLLSTLPWLADFDDFSLPSGERFYYMANSDPTTGRGSENN